MQPNDLLVIKLKYNLPNSSDGALNVFFYRVRAGTPVISQIVDNFLLDVVLPLRICQSTDVNYMSLEAYNQFDVSELDVRTWSVGELQGDIAEPCGSPFEAYSFTLRRQSRNLRNGSKRFGGVPDNAVERGQIISVGLIDNLNLLRDALSRDLDNMPDGGELQPVIVKRIRTANPAFPLTSRYPYLYRLPETQLEFVYSAFAAVQYDIFVSTQNSRKA